ncbi:MULTISPECIES: RNA polymerase sigma factor [unclassified Paenibacillus]|uniref:RNA polymerase sigma factor n=1 Tax=unclassified Paenibacillus TaxID=185978 RepID=UPI00362720F2
MNTHHVVENTVRDSYGRIISYLAVNWRDLEAVEDALADALVSALESWPQTGIPDKPEAWLLKVARRRLMDRARRDRVTERALPVLLTMSEEAQRMDSTEASFPDERLKMLFLCSHPEIDPSIHTPLMLQTVLGIDASRIATAFVVKPSTMGQRLTRAKAKMRTDCLTFTMPDVEELPKRLDAVLEAIYAAYGSGWDDLTGVDPRRRGLVDEAIYLGRLLSKYMPDEPEVQGLLSLMLHCEARREARRDDTGSYVPLSEQDSSRWSIPLMMEAERCLHTAVRSNRIGRFQLLAAIQSVHSQRTRTGRIEWEEIALLYEGLTRLSPTLGGLVGRAAAVAEAYGTEKGLALLEAIPQAKIVNYQPYWALAAHLYKKMEKFEEARTAYSRAIGLCEDLSVKQFLHQRAKEGMSIENI